MSVNAPIRILLMEDDAGQARLAQRHLQRAGYVVDLATDGDTGLALYKAETHDLLIVDHRMPGCGGLEVLRYLAAQGPLPPVIMVTGHGDETLAVQALRLGASDYVIKDVDGRYLALLPPVIERALQQWRWREEKRRAEAALQQAHDELEARVKERTAALARANALLQMEIAERQGARQALAQEHAFVSAILQTVEALVVVLDTQGRIVRFNQACERTTGYTFAEVQGKELWDLFLPPEERPQVRQVFDNLRAGDLHNAYTNSWRTRDGHSRLIAWSNTVLRDRHGAVEYIIGTGIDITEQHQAEAALAEQAARTRAILETAVDGIISIDEQGCIETFNPAAERIFGYTAAEVSGQNIKLLMPPPYDAEHDNYLARYLHTGEKRMIGIGHEVAGKRKDGSTFPLDLSVSEIRLGTRRLFTVFVRDISRRKQAEQALHDSEERFRLLVHTVGSVIIVLSPAYRILEFNQEAERVFGWSRAEVLGKNYVELFPGLTGRQAVLTDMHKVLLGEPTRGFENTVQTRDGRERVLLWNLTRFVNSDRIPIGIIASGQDITERKRAEQEMQRADRLALVGQLASGLAHEIGTPLNVIAGNAELLRLDLRERGLPVPELDTIVDQADRITRLMERLLTFARTKEQPVEPLSLEVPLVHALRLLETRFRHEAITVLVEVPGDLPLVRGAADQLEQVFLNLLVNAWHAMPGGGTVTIRAHATNADCVRIAFHDTGAGMSPEQLTRAFEPFFSTKGERGTGLGLAICKQIIDSHHGSITIDSILGNGTTVTVTLPSVPRADGTSTP
jgi:PAS domain S-box-containing protein